MYGWSFKQKILLCIVIKNSNDFISGSDSDKTKYDVQALHTALKDLLPEYCQKLESSIIIENYVGIGSLFHNRTGLGFFKIRGKVSF